MGKLSQKEVLLLAQGHTVYESQSHNSDSAMVGTCMENSFYEHPENKT